MENFETYRLDQTGQQTQAILDQVSTNTADIAQLRALYEALTQSEPVIIQPSDTWPVADPQENVIYRVIDRVNTPPQSYSDYMWNGTAMVLMATYNNSIDNEPTPGSNNLVKSGGVAASIVFDISAYHATGSTLATYADLAAALGTDGANVPASVRKGGMSVKFVKSSDNKYVQYRLMSDSFNTTPANWQGVDDEPTADSNNLVKSGGVFNSLINFTFQDSNNKIDYSLFQDKKSFNSETGEIDDNPNSMITGKQKVEPGTTIVFDNIYHAFYTDLFMWSEDGSFLGIVTHKPIHPFVVPNNVHYLGNYGGYGSTIEFYKFVAGSYITENDNLCNLQRKEVEDCAAAIGLTPRLVENLIFYAETSSANFTGTDNILSKYLPYRSGKIGSVDWGTGKYVYFVDGEAPVFIEQNTDLHWNRDISYDNLKDFDFEHTLVSFYPENPNYIQKIAIFKDSIIFSEEEWNLLHEKFNLPIFRNNKFNENGEWKSNRGFYKKTFVNLIKSPVFENPSDWQLDNEYIEIANNTVIFNDTIPTQGSLKQIVETLEVGKKYRLCYRISNYVSGSIQARIDYDTFEGQLANAASFVQEEFVYTHIGPHPRTFSFRPGSNGFVGSINIVELVKL